MLTNTFFRILVVCLVLAVVLHGARLMKSSGPIQLNKEEILACQIAQSAKTCPANSSGDGNSCVESERLVVVGDVHGSAAGLLELLYAAGITSTLTVSEGGHCQWKEDQPESGTILVQVGDIVDRGPEATEAWQCLTDLQSTASGKNKVIRLIGNHELWWLEHTLHQRNPEADTREKIIALLETMKQDILNGGLLGAYVHRLYGKPLMFIHAGFRPKFLEQLKFILQDASPEGMADYVNQMLVKFTAECSPSATSKCDYADDLFEAGPDRGGKGIGGPFWTDFGVIYEAAQKVSRPPEMIQLVGHTMAWCYDPSQPGVHPPENQAECGGGLVRAAAHLSSVCVDGGMYLGARAYLEIGSDGVFRSYQRFGGPETAWEAKDLTAAVCNA